ncbi:MAG: hypothetical protein ACJASB_002062 [Shewanella psychromarinicola]|jgi:hypothetical protein
MKQKRCMMNPEFLERVLLAGFASEVKKLITHADTLY